MQALHSLPFLTDDRCAKEWEEKLFWVSYIILLGKKWPTMEKLTFKCTSDIKKFQSFLQINQNLFLSNKKQYKQKQLEKNIF